MGVGSLFSNKVKIEIDIGQKTSFWRSTIQKTLKDESGKAIKFNSMVDAINYMASLGWEFVQAYAFSVGNQNVYHYLLKRNTE